MKNTLAKALWFVFGLVFAALHVVMGIAFLFITPPARKHFMLAKLALNPFDRAIGNLTATPTQRATRNFLFTVLFGFIFTILYCVIGLVLCATIIGIPAGKNCLKKIVPVCAKPFNYAVV